MYNFQCVNICAQKCQFMSTLLTWHVISSLHLCRMTIYAVTSADLDWFRPLITTYFSKIAETCCIWQLSTCRRHICYWCKDVVLLHCGLSSWLPVIRAVREHSHMKIPNLPIPPRIAHSIWISYIYIFLILSLYL